MKMNEKYVLVEPWTMRLRRPARAFRTNVHAPMRDVILTERTVAQADYVARQ